MEQFKGTVIVYPLCILAIWLPCVYLGVLANGASAIPGGTRDDVLLLLLRQYAPEWLAGILGAGIMAAVMASDSQILALSTMFTEDVFAYYGGKARFGETVQVQTGRIFVVILTVIAYLIALRAPQSIFDLAVQYAFSGYAALSPLLFAALFWKRSTKWGALAVALWTAAAVIYTARVPGGLAWFGLMPVVPMTLVSCGLMIVVSLLTNPPSRATIERYR
jgi:SSS family solute:Na+ symporter